MRLKLIVFVGLFLLLASSVSAQLTTPQLQTLKASIAAASDQAVSVPGNLCAGFVGTAINAIPNSSDGNVCVAAQYNLTASPAFTVWKTNVPQDQVGRAFNPVELASLSSLNTQRLQNIEQWFNTFNPSLAGDRAFFDDIFSGAGGATTRASLLVLWKRLALRGERLYTTGTGSDAVPGLLVFEGALTAADVSTARNLP